MLEENKKADEALEKEEDSIKELLQQEDEESKEKELVEEDSDELIKELQNVILENEGRSGTTHERQTPPKVNDSRTLSEEQSVHDFESYQAIVSTNDFKVANTDVSVDQLLRSAEKEMQMLN